VVLEDLPPFLPARALRVWGLAFVLLVLTGVCFFAVADEPFWCLKAWEVLELLVLPGLIAGGWLGLFLLVWSNVRERGMRGTLVLLPFLAAPSLFVSTSCALAYLEDLRRSPALLCSDMPDYGRCHERQTSAATTLGSGAPL
jgi:hypothetical protein